MNTTVKLGTLLLAAVPLVSLAQEEPKLSCIKDIVFSQEFLARYPKAGAACREVVMKEGKKWARFDANVADVRGSKVTANFIDTFNRPVETLTIDASPEARVQVDGKEVKFSAMEKGDKLSFWMPEDRVGFYASPGASESTKLAVVDNTATKR